MEHTTADTSPRSRLLGRTVLAHRRTEFYLLWIGATLAYGVGDLLTTLYFMTNDLGIVEANRLITLVVDAFGHGGFVGLKLLVFLTALAISVLAAEYWNDRTLYYGPPLLLIVLGSVVTINNLYLLSLVT